MNDNQDNSQRGGDGVPASAGRSRAAGIAVPALRWLYSVELALWVLGLLLVAMVLGTVIPQRAPAADYERMFGQALGRLIARSSLTDIFHAWWFGGLFALLAVNLVGCALRRLRSLTRAERAAAVGGQQARESFDLRLEPEAAYQRVAGALAAQGYRVAPEQGGAGAPTPAEQAPAAGTGIPALQLRAGRGRSRRWGPLVVHVGMVVVLAGWLYGRSQAFDYRPVIAAGETYAVQVGERSFGIRLLDAGTETTETGAPAEYWAQTEVIEQGEVVRKYTISMNRPLRHYGTNVVLSSIWGGGPRLAVEITGEGEPIYLPVQADPTGAVDVMHSITRLRERGWLIWAADLRQRERGPEVLLRVDESGAVSEQRRDLGWVGPEGLDYQGLRLELVSTHSPVSVQLGVHRDPGIPVVWAGFLLIVLGTLLASFVTRREVAATLAPAGAGRTTIKIGASAFGLSPDPAGMLQSLCSEIQSRQEEKR